MTQLSPAQQAHLQSLVQFESYADGYRYVKDIVDSARQGESDSPRASDLEITSHWLDNAASINADDGSPKSEFVREATKSAGEQVGKPIFDADFQRGSDELARDVLSDIADKGEVPTAGEIISKDVAKAAASLGLPNWAAKRCASRRAWHLRTCGKVGAGGTAKVRMRTGGWQHE